MNDTAPQIANYEITPIKPADAGGPVPQRLLIVHDIFGNEEPEWTLELIEEIMSWSDFDPRVEDWSRLVFANPRHHTDQYRANGYFKAWLTWASKLATNDVNGVRVTHHYEGLDRRQHIVSHDTTASCLVSAYFYMKDFFDQFLTEEDADDNLELLEQIKHHEYWLDILQDHVCGLADFDFWTYDRPHEKTVMQRLADGDTRITTYIGDDGSDATVEIYILERAEDGTLKPRAFVLPRSFDSAGHLP